MIQTHVLLSEGAPNLHNISSKYTLDPRSRLTHNPMLMFLIMNSLSLRTQTPLPRLTRPNIPKRSSRNPRPGSTRHLDLRIQLINLLQCKTLGLINHKVHKRNTQKAAREPDEKDLALQIRVSWAEIDEIRCRVGDGPVEEPVRGRRHRETFCADFEREDLACYDPGDRTPGGREEEDVDADEGDGGALGGEVEGEGEASDGVLAGVDGAEGGNDELRDAHPDGAGEEEGAAAEFVDGVEAGDGGADVYGGGDHGDYEGVFDAGVGEVGGAVVEDEVDSGKLHSVSC
jgi:hypothetical protein